MTAGSAQYRFAAEFVVFLAAVAGVALAALRSELLTRSRAVQSVLVAGFTATGLASFLAGSLLREADDPLVLGLRGFGVVALASGLTTWTGRPRARTALAVGLAFLALDVVILLASDTDSWSAAARTLGGLGLGLALLLASTRSIATRVAASGAATLLLVVLVLSVGLSVVLADTVEDNELDQLDNRALLESSGRIRALRDEAIRGARLVQDTLITLDENDCLNLDLAEAKSPETAGALSAVVDTCAPPDPNRQPTPGILQQLSEKTLSGMPLGYITAQGVVVATAPAEIFTLDDLLPVAGSDIFEEVKQSRTEAGSVEVVDRRAMVLAAVAVATEDGEILGAVVAAQPLDDTYLEIQAQDREELSLTMAGASGVVAKHGAQPAPDLVARLTRRVLETGQGVNEVTTNRFIAAQKVENSQGTPVLALLASTPSDTVEEARKTLFRTFFLIALGLTILAIVLAAVVGDRTAAGLRRLTAAAESVRAGQLGVRSGVASEDEVGVLSGAFDSMVASLEENAEALRRAAEEEAELRARLEAIVGGMGEALVAYDSDGIVTDVNAAAEELLGRRSDEVRGERVDKVVPLRTEEGADISQRFLVPDAGRWTANGSVATEHGDVPVLLTAGSLAADNGGVLVLRDLRGEIEVERMKREFLSRVGHELRTPLTPMIGFAKLLATRDVPPERAKDLHQSIYSSATRLQRIVEMLEFFSSLEAGRTVLRPEPFDIGAVVEEAVARRSEEDGTHVTRKVKRGTPAVLADKHWVGRAVDELLDNAIKFSPQGVDVAVTAGRVQEDGMSWVEVTVADKGVGMSADDVDHAFAEWVQGDESDTRAYGGLGLGLALVRRVAEGHGGRVRCTSSPGKGSKFSILLPHVPTEERNATSGRGLGRGRLARRRRGVREEVAGS